MLQELVVQILNISLMFSVGLELDLDEVRAAARRRGLLVAIVIVNFAVIPLLAFGATQTLSIPSAITAGILLSAFAPGGGTGTLLTRISGGKLELSVVMLGLFTLLAVPLTPTLTLATTASFEGTKLELSAMLRTLVLLQLAPLGLGVALRHRSADLSRGANAIARPVSNLVFGGLVVGLLITRGHLVLEVGWMALVTIVLLVTASLVIPALLPGSVRDRAALSLTSGVRNLSLALLLSTAFFTDLTTITVLTYGLVMYLFGIPSALWIRRSTASPTTTSPDTSAAHAS